MKMIRELVVLGLLLHFTTGHCSADMLDSWHWRNPTPFANSLRGVCFGDGKFVAVGDGGVIHTSLDGVSWDDGRRTTTSTLFKVIFANGQFVAVGDDGVIVTSSDGYSWTNRVSGTTNTLYSIAYGNGKYVACGQGGQLTISTNGSDWVLGNAGTYDSNWIAFGNGLFIVNEPSQQFITSAQNQGDQQLAVPVSGDAQTWTRELLPTSFPIQYPIGICQVEFGNGVFVAVVQDEEYYQVSWVPTAHFYQSTDGTNWAQGALDAAGPTFSFSQHDFLAFSGGFFYEFTSRATISRTFNGNSCDTFNAPTDAANATGIAFGYGRYVLTAPNGELWTSPDATNWTSDYGGLRAGINQILRAGNYYIVLAASEPILISSDGIHFTPAGNSPTNVLGNVAYDGTNYVAVGVSQINSFSGFTGEVYTSTNSTDWVRRTSNATQALAAVCPGANRWVAVGGSGTVISSPNTLAWTLRSSGTANNLNGVAYGNNVYVAVGSGGTVISSPDGATWDVQYSGTTANLNRVRFLNGQFFAVGAKGTLLSSTDGSSWSVPTSGTIRGLSDVAYGNGHYLACGADYDPQFHGDSPYLNVVLESTNGLDWEDITTNVPVYGGLNSLAFYDGSFWLCGGTGALLQSDSADGIPRLAGAMLTGKSGFQLKISLNVPPTYRIQVSTNLAGGSWQDVITNTAPLSVWTDTNVLASPIRLYRIISP
jgi:hypothetical protein